MEIRIHVLISSVESSDYFDAVVKYLNDSGYFNDVLVFPISLDRWLWNKYRFQFGQIASLNKLNDKRKKIIKKAHFFAKGL